MADQSGFPRTGREVALRTPLTEEQVRSLKVGDVACVGRAYTGRDAAPSPDDARAAVDLRGAIIYHCGPVVAKDGNGWRVTAAGPTTSIREEPYQGDIIKRFGVRAVIGKGGMGGQTLAALPGVGSGLPQRYRWRGSVLRANHQERRWRLTDGVRNARGDVAPDDRGFPAIVTMDAHGNSLHKDVEQGSARELAAIGR